jgi:hypothetical protein
MAAPECNWVYSSIPFTAQCGLVRGEWGTEQNCKLAWDITNLRVVGGHSIRWHIISAVLLCSVNVAVITRINRAAER